MIGILWEAVWSCKRRVVDYSGGGRPLGRRSAAIEKEAIALA